MKKAVIGTITAMMVLCVGATSVFAAGPGYRRNFTDADRTGICGCIKGGCQYIDTDNDRVCDNYVRQETKPRHGFCGRHNR